MQDIILLHGALGSQQQFTEFIPLLNNQYTIHALNFSGHGGTTFHTDGYNFDVFADDILAYMNAHNLPQVSFFGFSMGGYAALYFASKYPERVKQIMTLNTKFNWNPESSQKETALLNAEKIKEKVPQYAQALMHEHGENNWENVLLQTKYMMLALGDKPVLDDNTLHKIQCNVLIGVGDRDNTATIIENIEVYKTLANAQLLVLPNTPHPFNKINHHILVQHFKQFFTT